MIRNPYAKAKGPPRNPNASNTAASSPAAKRPRSSSPRSGVVENGKEPGATTAVAAAPYENILHLQVPARPPTRVGGTGSVSRLVQPASRVVAPGQKRLAEHNNDAQHASNKSSAYGGGNNGNNNSNPGLDDDFGGIDWDAAVLQLDAPSSSATTQSVASVAKNKHSSSSTAATTTGSGQLVDLTASPPPPPPPAPATTNNNTRNPTATMMTETLKPPLHSKVAAASSPSRSLASVQHPAMLQRPAAWTSGASMSGSPASVTSQTAANTTVDPLQATLPKALQFDAGQVKPVNDEHRALLVKNAHLSSPLLNGWTLFSHQKKAILRGLLMRRMILALDMGLG
jgi:hypothetical protein